MLARTFRFREELGQDAVDVKKRQKKTHQDFVHRVSFAVLYRLLQTVLFLNSSSILIEMTLNCS